MGSCIALGDCNFRAAHAIPPLPSSIWVISQLRAHYPAIPAPNRIFPCAHALVVLLSTQFTPLEFLLLCNRFATTFYTQTIYCTVAALIMESKERALGPHFAHGKIRCGYQMHMCLNHSGSSIPSARRLELVRACDVCRSVCACCLN